MKLKTTNRLLLIWNIGLTVILLVGFWIFWEWGTHIDFQVNRINEQMERHVDEVIATFAEYRRAIEDTRAVVDENREGLIFFEEYLSSK